MSTIFVRVNHQLQILGCLGQIWVHSFFLHLTGMTTTGFWSYYNCLHFWTFLRPLLENIVEDTQDRFQMMYSHSDTSRPQAMLICFGLFMELASSASEVLEPSEMWKPSLKPLARAGGVTARSMQIYVTWKSTWFCTACPADICWS